ncbi:MAG: hydantoinase B/oxoprolinase family protein [Christensenellales bacterium]
MSVKIDGILLEVINNTFMSIAEEMGAVLIKSAYSTNIKERKDCSCGIFDAQGNTIAQAEHIPMHLGSMLEMVSEINKHYSPEEILEGDMFIANDPYNGGGTHLPDITIATPVFWEEEVVAYVINIAHHSDVGGRVPGSNAADSASIYEEGIRIPPVKIFHQGKLDDDVLRLILLNCRVTDIRRGDLSAQFACNRKGQQRVQEIFARYGKEVMLHSMAEMLNYSERKMRLAIKEIPDGIFSFTDYLDSDGRGSDPVPINVTLEIGGDEILADFTDNVPQVRGALNLTRTATLSCIYYSLKSIIDPSLPSNGGYYRPIKYKMTPGTLVCCSDMAAVAGRTDTAQRVVSIIYGAMAQVMPQKVVAGSHDAITGVYFGGTNPKTGKYYVYVETIAGGSGARFNKDGLDAVQVHMTNTSNLPIESLETEYPLMVGRYQLVTDSGGAGRYRGGLAIRKDLYVLDHECTFSIKADRQKLPPWGLAGGKEGTMGQVILNPGTESETVLDSKKSNTILPAGSVLCCMSPGAGGYGDPLKRDKALIFRDLEQGMISKESAMQDYGLSEKDLNGREIYQA